MSDDIMSMTQDEIIAKYSTQDEAPQWALSQEGRDYIGRVKRENPGMSESELMQRALRNGLQDMQRQKQSGRGPVGKRPAVQLTGRGFGGMR